MFFFLYFSSEVGSKYEQARANFLELFLLLAVFLVDLFFILFYFFFDEQLQWCLSWRTKQVFFLLKENKIFQTHNFGKVNKIAIPQMKITPQIRTSANTKFENPQMNKPKEFANPRIKGWKSTNEKSKPICKSAYKNLKNPQEKGNPGFCFALFIWGVQNFIGGFQVFISRFRISKKLQNSSKIAIWVRYDPAFLSFGPLKMRAYRGILLFWCFFQKKQK